MTYHQLGLPFSNWQRCKAPVTPRSPSAVITHTLSAKCIHVLSASTVTQWGETVWSLLFRWENLRPSGGMCLIPPSKDQSLYTNQGPTKSIAHNCHDLGENQPTDTNRDLQITNLTETPYSHMWPLLGTHTINSLFLFFGIYLTLLCITVVYIPLSCMLLCHKLFNAHTHVLILSYASLHLPIAGIQEKHNRIYEWLRNKKKKGGKEKERRQEKGERKQGR